MHKQDRDHAGSAGFIEAFGIVCNIHGFGRIGGMLKLNSHPFKLGEGRGDIFVGALGVGEAGWLEKDSSNWPH